MNPALTYKGNTLHDHTEVSEWCYANCGEFDVGWYRLGSDPLAYMMASVRGEPVPRDVYYFATEEMLTLFLLRWT